MMARLGTDHFSLNPIDSSKARTKLVPCSETDKKQGEERFPSKTEKAVE